MVSWSLKSLTRSDHSTLFDSNVEDLRKSEPTHKETPIDFEPGSKLKTASLSDGKRPLLPGLLRSAPLDFAMCCSPLKVVHMY